LGEHDVSELTSPTKADTDADEDLNGRFKDTDVVDEVIVDRSWASPPSSPSSSSSDLGSAHSGPGSSTHSRPPSVTAVDDPPLHGLWSFPPLAFARTRAWSVVKTFYAPRFADPAEERVYQREVWSQGKRPSLWASVFFIASCVLGAATIQRPVVLADRVRVSAYHLSIYPFILSSVYSSLHRSIHVLTVCCSLLVDILLCHLPRALAPRPLHVRVQLASRPPALLPDLALYLDVVVVRFYVSHRFFLALSSSVHCFSSLQPLLRFASPFTFV
jgi:hypothetical protein